MKKTHSTMKSLEGKNRICISFSGGRTSAVMTKLLLDKYRDTHEISVTFANTGCEHEATLEFVRDCDEKWGFGTVWLEAVVTHGERVGIRHKIVDFNTASRNGEPFEEYIKKYGIPNAGSPQCTSRLKEEVLDSYRHRDLGWEKGTYATAIGIRADEVDRVSVRMMEKNFIYPLVAEGFTKEIVNAYCRQSGFDLKIPSDAWGNCVWCWKKSLRKLMTVAKNDPSAFDFPKRMEEKYSTIKAANQSGKRVFFRNYRSTMDILELAKGKFEEYRDSEQMSLFDNFLDVGSACGESCEIGADDDRI